MYCWSAREKFKERLCVWFVFVFLFICCAYFSLLFDFPRASCALLLRYLCFAPPLSAGFISNSYIGTHSNQHAHSMSQHSQTIDMLALHMSETMIMAALVVAACGVLYTLLLLRMKSRQPGSKTPEQWNQDLLVSVV